jgi:hypothetical protein
MTEEKIIDPLVGSKIGPCRIEMRLAAGGMGVVYRARHLQLKQEVAVKILAPTLATDQEYVTRFFLEAGAAGQIDHPNVVRVIDVGRHEDLYYLIMEFVPGETLDFILQKERRLSLERASRIMREVAMGLAAAHRAGIIHRDVKPANIIVSPDGKPHLTDFGLARHAGAQKGVTVEGTFLGTPEYASPEQVEGRKLDHRTDLYSLGLTYYELLSGTLPFLGEFPMEVAIKRTKEEARPLESAFPGADPRACAITKKLLNMEPGERYQNATDVIRDLHAIIHSGQSDTVRVSGTTRKVENLLIAARVKHKVRSFFHWDLMSTAIVLAFLSGGLADRGGRCIERWVAGDDRLLTRIVLAVVAAMVGAGAMFVYHRELPSKGRKLLLGFLVALMLFTALAAGTMIDRGEGSGIVVLLGNSIRAAAAAPFHPVNRFLLGLVALFAAVQISFERQPGFPRVLVCRILMIAGFFLIYAFGSGGPGLDAPFRNFMAVPEMAIPVATAALLGCFFFVLLVTGYSFENRAKSFGTLLGAGSTAGLFAFAVLVSQPMRQESWIELLAEPFSGFGRSFLKSGGLLAGVIFLAVIDRAVLFATMRSQDRSYRKRF